MGIKICKIMMVRRATRLWWLETMALQIFSNFYFYVAKGTTLGVPDQVD